MIIDSLSNFEYHARPDISNSQLDALEVGPWYWHAMHRAEGRPERKEKAGQMEGTLAHCTILEPDEFDDRYIVIPGDAPKKPTSAQRNAKKPSAETKDIIDWWESFDRDANGRIAITLEQCDVAWRQHEHAMSMPDFRESILCGKPELSVFWSDPVTGINCRCRPDLAAYFDSGVVLWDVKTYSTSDIHRFELQAARKSYHRQQAFYSDGWATETGSNPLAFVFLVVGMEYPWPIRAVQLPEIAEESGRMLYRRNLSSLIEAIAANNFGFPQRIEIADWPRYATIVSD